MARIRQIKPEFFLDEDLAQCSRDARLLFAGLWCLADRAGRLEERPARIKIQIFPYDDDLGPKQICLLLDELTSQRFIIRYTAGNRLLIQIRTFDQHQHFHVSERQSQLPGPQQVTNEHGTSTVQAPVEHGTSTVLARRLTSYGLRLTSSASASTSTIGEDMCVCAGSSSGTRPENRRQQTSKNHTHTPPPINFFLTKELLSWTENAAPEIDPQAETEKFLDHYRSKGKTSANWEAAWREWIRIAVERQERARSPTWESRDEHNRRAAEEANRMIEADRTAKRNA